MHWLWQVHQHCCRVSRPLQKQMLPRCSMSGRMECWRNLGPTLQNQGCCCLARGCQPLAVVQPTGRAERRRTCTQTCLQLPMLGPAYPAAAAGSWRWVRRSACSDMPSDDNSGAIGIVGACKEAGDVSYGGWHVCPGQLDARLVGARHTLVDASCRSRVVAKYVRLTTTTGGAGCGQAKSCAVGATPFPTEVWTKPCLPC